MVKTGEHRTGEHGTRKYGMGKYKYLFVLERVASIATLVAGKYDVRILMLRMWCSVGDYGVMAWEYDNIVIVAHVYIDHPIYI